VPLTPDQEEVVEVAEAMVAVVERRTRWAAADTLVAVDTLAVVDTLAAAAACVLAARLMLAALRAWAAVGHISEADRTSARVISAADQRDRGLAADQREYDLLRGRVPMLSVRSHRPAQTGTPRSDEITRQQTSAETETRV
jgi:hypothetical protein